MDTQTFRNNKTDTSVVFITFCWINVFYGENHLSYVTWGNRRNPENWAELYPTGNIPNLHGFTGHEHMDLFRLINMNGRVYDPVIGRFLSADPFVQMPDNLQGLNRYSYCLNNPLSLVDPTGYSFKSASDIATTIASISFSIVFTAATAGAGAPMIVAAMAGGFAGEFIGGFSSSALAGAELNDAMKAGAIGGLIGGTSGAITFGIGSATDGIKYELLIKTLAHGTAQGGIEELQGGKFIHGFAAGSFSSLAGSYTVGWNSYGARVIASSVIGGTASYIGGGKFANGAITGAYVAMFNGCMHGYPPPSWIYDPDSWHNSTLARILYPDAWVFTGFGTSSDVEGISFEIGLIWMQRGPETGYARFFLMPEGVKGWAKSAGVKYMGFNFTGPVSRINFKRFQSLTLNVDASIPFASVIGVSASWSYDWSWESFGVIGRGGSIGWGESLILSGSYPFWLSKPFLFNPLP